MTHNQVIDSLRQKFGADAVAASEFRDNQRVTIPSENILAVLDYLKSEAGLSYLAELGAADYLEYPNAKDRFGVWYVLNNLDTGVRLIVKTWVNDPDPTLPSVYDLWNGADWMEREVYDMYGIVFDGHPDLRRILMPDEFTMFPLRRDYPMRGRGERHNFPVITRAEG